MEYYPLTESGNVAVDDLTGDLYLWNEEIGQYELYDYSRHTSADGPTYIVVDNGSSDDPVDQMAVSQVSDVSGSEVNLSGDSVSAIAEAVADYAAADGYNLGTTYVGIFAGIAQKIPFGQSYVYWRDDQYSYKLAYGEISLDGNVFQSSEPVTVVTYTTSSGYNSVYSFSERVDSDFTLSAGSALVYSDLGSYPDIFNRREMKFNVFTGYACSIAFAWVLFSNLRKAAFGR